MSFLATSHVLFNCTGFLILLSYVTVTIDIDNRHAAEITQKDGAVYIYVYTL